MLLLEQLISIFRRRLFGVVGAAPTLIPMLLRMLSVRRKRMPTIPALDVATIFKFLTKAGAACTSKQREYDMRV